MDIKIGKCSYCGGKEFGEGLQWFQGGIQASNSILKTSSLHHVICLSCGSVVRSYVEKPARFK